MSSDLITRLKERAAEYRRSETPQCDVSEELSYLRSLASELKNDSSLNLPQRLSMIKGIFDSIRALAQVDFKVGLASNKYLTQEAALRLAGDYVQICIDEIQDLPDFEDRADRIVERIAAVTARASNTRKDIKRLERREK